MGSDWAVSSDSVLVTLKPGSTSFAKAPMVRGVTIMGDVTLRDPLRCSNRAE